MTDDSMPTASDVRIETAVLARMRDGTVLRADVVRPIPRRAGETFPVLLTRAPCRKRPLEWIARGGAAVGGCTGEGGVVEEER